MWDFIVTKLRRLYPIWSNGIKGVLRSSSVRSVTSPAQRTLPWPWLSPLCYMLLVKGFGENRMRMRKAATHRRTEHLPRWARSTSLFLRVLCAPCLQASPCHPHFWSEWGQVPFLQMTMWPLHWDYLPQISIIQLATDNPSPRPALLQYRNKKHAMSTNYFC